MVREAVAAALDVLLLSAIVHLLSFARDFFEFSGGRRCDPMVGRDRFMVFL